MMSSGLNSIDPCRRVKSYASAELEFGRDLIGLEPDRPRRPPSSSKREPASASAEARCLSPVQSEMFARYHRTRSQSLPQCCKYLADPLTKYLLYARNVPAHLPAHTVEETIEVDDEGFLRVCRTTVVFDLAHLETSTPEDIEHYVDATRRLSAHDSRLLKLVARDRWYKGDFERLRRVLTQRDVSALIAFACNVLWERGYENHYTLGQQLSIRITTKLIQSGLDFKHQRDKETASVDSRGWADEQLEKIIASLPSISSVIKRHRSSHKFVVLELLPQRAADIKASLGEHFAVVENKRVANLCALRVDHDKNSLQYLNKLNHLICNKVVNVVFVTDVDFYLKRDRYLFYLYNSLKFYYYCLCNKFVFEQADHEIIFLLNLIVSLEWHNGGHLNSFTLEKSPLYNPLELSTRRLNSIKRAANESRTLHNDNEIKIDFIKGKRMKTGSHYGHRIVSI
uniref:p47 n=2 Tax=Lymantria dispar multicapsid nuclear polyhedrosis virus TaxID=10449 RepID=A0A6H0F2H2_NPVLD|nr:p47 [Lymantria dispar multiple nucleopolyhedrovirus]